MSIRSAANPSALNVRRSLSSWCTAWAAAVLVTAAGVCSAQIITTIAGGPPATPGTNIQSRIGIVSHAVADNTGTIYFSDTSNDRILKVLPGSQYPSVVAGNGVRGFAGDGDLAIYAQLNTPGGLALDGSNNLYIADSGNRRIRKVALSTGYISTIAGSGSKLPLGDGASAVNAGMARPVAVTLDAAGNLFFSDGDQHLVRRIAAGTGIITTVAGNGTRGALGDGGPATAAQLRNPVGLAVDGAGNLYIADALNHRIRRVNTSGVMQTVAGTGIKGFDGDGGPATSARLSHPVHVVIDLAGDLLISDAGNLRIRRVAAGVIETYAGTGAKGTTGDGGPALAARFSYPAGLSFNLAGNLIVADTANQRVRIIDRTSRLIVSVAGNHMSTLAAVPQIANQVVAPTGVAVDPAGNVIVADAGAHAVLRIAAGSGTVSTIAGTGVADFAGDGGAAQSASLSQPSGVAVDAAGNIFVADTGNQRVRRIAAGTNVITTVAGDGVSGYLGDGGPATSASLSYPSSVAVSAGGDLYIADTQNHRIRRVSGGIITTFAGTGTQGNLGLGGPATSAQLASPTAIALHPSGDVFISCKGTDSPLRIAAGTGIISKTANMFLNSYPAGLAVLFDGTLYGAFGQISRVLSVGSDASLVVAGGFAKGYSGDGGNAASALLNYPAGLAFDAQNNLYIADTANRAVRKVALTVPGTPQNISVVPGDGWISVSANTPSSGGARILDYTAICGSKSQTGTGWPIVVTGLTNGTPYTCTLSARNALGTSAPSFPSASVTPVGLPGAPTSVTAVAGNGSATISFVPPASNGGSAIWNYSVSAGTGFPLASGPSSPIVVTGLSNGTPYNFTVRATNFAGAGPASAASNIVTPATLPSPPTIGIVTAGNAQIVVSFFPNSNGGSAILDYTATCGSVSATGSGSPIVVTGLSNGASYTCSVVARNGIGTSAPSGNSSSVIPQTTPGAPTIFDAVPGNGQVTVAFLVPVNTGGASIISYTLTASPGGQSWTAATSPITASGLANGTGYTFTVRAQNANGPGPASAPSDVVTPRTTPSAPAVTGAAAGDAQISVAFTPPAGNGGAPILDYTARCLAAGNGQSANQTGTASPLTVTGLVNGTRYTCSVSARNAAGSGAFSAATTELTPKAVTAVWLASSSNPALQGATVTFTATIAGATPSSTGTVTFTFGDGLSCANRPLTNGSATCTRTLITPGMLSVQANYSGDGANLPAVGNLGQQVTFTGLVRGTSDLDGDGKSDIVWYNTATGLLFGLRMNGATLGAAATLDQRSDLNWKVAAVADLNGDGKSDIVWHNTSTGVVQGLQMNGTPTPDTGTLYAEPNTNWKIVGAGDFNGDGKTDLLWKNDATGDVYMLLVNGLQALAGAVVYSEPNNAWKIQKVADFDSDGKADILWRNAATGDVFMMLMNGTAVKGGGVIYSEPNQNWQIQAAADFNGDGRADILWRNVATGDVYMMLMMGTSIIGGSVFYAEPDMAWKIVASGDYNGDNKADILWRNTSTGQVYLMLMNGSAIANGAFVYTETDQNWKILGP